MKNKFLLFALFLLLLPVASIAGDNASNTITYQYSASSWVASHTANVIVSVNAAVNTSELSSFEQTLPEKLNRIVKAPWHITQFYRNDDKSGLESVQVQAEARVATEKMNGLKEKAKAISKAGETYSIVDVHYSPSLVEVEQAYANLRETMLQQIQQQVSSLNRLFPKQNYTIHHIDFTQGFQAVPMAAKVAGPMVLARTENSSLQTSQQVELTAKITLSTAAE